MKNIFFCNILTRLVLEIKKKSFPNILSPFVIPVLQAGYMAIPSPRQPSPGKLKYYRGGYITQVVKMIINSNELVNFDLLHWLRPMAPQMEELWTQSSLNYLLN